MMQQRHSFNTPQRARNQHLYTNVVFQEQRYRILAREHTSTVSTIQVWRAVWAIMTLAILGALLHSLGSLLVGRQNMPHFMKIVLSCTTGGLGWVCYLMHQSWQQVSRMTAFSALNGTYLFLTWTILLWCNVDSLKYATLVYICAESLGSMLFMHNRSQLMGKFIIMLQLFLIALKLDDAVEAEWRQVLFGFILGHIIGMIAVASIVILFCINTLYFRESSKSIKHIGLGFICLHALCLALNCAVPVSEVIEPSTGVPHEVVCIVTCLVNCFNIFYNKQHMVEISIFLCKVEPVKSFNQIISLAILDADTYRNLVFIKKSDNWYVKANLEALDGPPSTKEINTAEATEEGEKCLICLEANACVVWEPCGHLTVCKVCCETMFEKKNSNCLLCKNTPDVIYFVEEPKEDIIEDDGNFSDAIQDFGNFSSCQPKQDPATFDKNDALSREVLYITSAYSIRIC